MKKRFSIFIALVFIGLTAFGREAVCVEFKMTSASVTGNMKTYSSAGDTRSEVVMKAPSMPNPMTSVTLILHNSPGSVYMLNERDKTYSELDASRTAGDHKEEDDYEITVLGKEKIGEYNCVHTKVTNKRTQHSSELWMSKDVKGYANYVSVKTKYFGGSKFFNTLKEKGAEGFVVRMVVSSERGGSVQMDLVKAEKQNVDESLFSLGGYTKGGSAAPGRPAPGQMPGGVSAEDLQKMTPDERKAYIEKMKAQYGQQQPQH